MIRRAAWVPPVLTALAVASFSSAIPAQDSPVSREEHEALRREVEALRKELAEARKQRESHDEETDAALDEMGESLDSLEKDARNRTPGTANFLLSGNATISYFDRENDTSTFTAVFRPVFLWKLSDRLFLEAKPEIRLRSGTEEASFTLEYANVSYVVNDWLTVGAGKFLVPFGMFPDRFYPGKLLEEPLVYQRGDTGIAPHSDVGAFARGAFEMDFLGAGPYEANYAAWVSNGPVLRTRDPARAGTVDFGGAFRDVNDDKAVGGRLGFLPFPALEVGASVQYAEVDPPGFEKTGQLLYGVDLQYYETFRRLRGSVEVRAEWVWSHVDHLTYDPTGVLGFGPLDFENDRNGGYVEVAYRPSLVDNRFLRDTEWIARYDRLEVPDDAPGPVDEQRLTVGLLYWVTATTSVRAGYIFSDAEGPDRDTFFLQTSVGF